MIFQHTIDDVLSGRKTQTRRLVKLGEIYHWKAINSRGNVVSASAYHYDPHDQHHQRTLVPGTIEITRVSQKPRHGNPEWRKRLKWKVGKIYAVQPGVGKKQVGRIRITGIRQEHLQDISGKDAIAEGIDVITPLQKDFRQDHLYAWADGSPAYKDYLTGNWHKQKGECCCCYEGAEANRHAAVCSYKSLWDTINTKPGTRWDDNPLVWVLDFELVTDD